LIAIPHKLQETSSTFTRCDWMRECNWDCSQKSRPDFRNRHSPKIKYPGISPARAFFLSVLGCMPPSSRAAALLFNSGSKSCLKSEARACCILYSYYATRGAIWSEVRAIRFFTIAHGFKEVNRCGAHRPLKLSLDDFCHGVSEGVTLAAAPTLGENA
jgi:hypothetical protein